MKELLEKYEQLRFGIQAALIVWTPFWFNSLFDEHYSWIIVSGVIQLLLLVFLRETQRAIEDCQQKIVEQQRRAFEVICRMNVNELQNYLDRLDHEKTR